MPDQGRNSELILLGGGGGESVDREALNLGSEWAEAG